MEFRWRFISWTCNDNYILAKLIFAYFTGYPFHYVRRDYFCALIPALSPMCEIFVSALIYASIRTLFRVIILCRVAFISLETFRACEFLLLLTRHFSRTELLLCRLGFVSLFALQPPNRRIDSESDRKRYGAALKIQWHCELSSFPSLLKSDLSSFSFYFCV